MGRGNQFSTHPGNIRFYSVIDQFVDAYFDAKTKFEKSRVVQQVFQELSTSARFLRRDPSSKKFFVITDTDARQKISHAIRYRRQNSNSSSNSNNSRSSSPATISSPGLVSGDIVAPKVNHRRIPQNQSNRFRDFSETELPQNAITLPSKDHRVIDLFSDEDLDCVLGHPHEYLDHQDMSPTFLWPEPSTMSPIIEYAPEHLGNTENE